MFFARPLAGTTGVLCCDSQAELEDASVSSELSERAVDGGDGSLGDLYRSVAVGHKHTGFCAKLYAFTGPGALVAVGYMDPGNWATDLAAGSAYNYKLLFVIMCSSLIAMFLQVLALRLGMVTRLDLAQACKQQFPRPVSIFMWVTAEIAIAATDLAEVIGSAVAMKLLFGLPVISGVVFTACDVIFLLAFGGADMRIMEAIVAGLMSVIFVCFVIELCFAKPDGLSMLVGCFIPSSELVTDQKMLLIAIGILGATVMPHNLYLHSSLVQTRDVPKDIASMKTALRFATLDSNCALSLAFFVNASILVLAAATFFRHGHNDVAGLEEAFHMLRRILGNRSASIVFAVALLASGQQSTLTGTLAGQIVMEGFVAWQVRPWIRRIATRLLAIVPAVFVIYLGGENQVTNLLIGSQVVLSFQLAFAVLPLVYFTSDRQLMGEFVNSSRSRVLGWTLAVLILTLNMFLIAQVAGWA